MMRRFLYYFPGIPGINPRMLADRGLLDRFIDRPGADPVFSVMGIDDGPAGRGCVVGYGEGVPNVEGAKWAEGEKCWVSVEGSLPPRPCDLVREIGIRGHELPLADAQAWRVPLIRRWDAENMRHAVALPTALSMRITGGKSAMQAQVRPEYAAVDELAEKLIAGFFTETKMPLEDLYRSACALLAVNYRIGVDEANLLGILDADSALQICAVAIDYPALREQAQAAAVQGIQYTEPVIEEE